MTYSYTVRIRAGTIDVFGPSGRPILGARFG